MWRDAKHGTEIDPFGNASASVASDTAANRYPQGRTNAVAWTALTDDLYMYGGYTGVFVRTRVRAAHVRAVASNSSL